MNIRQITIAGAGQIGTSLVLALAQKYPDTQIVAFDTSPGLERDFHQSLAKSGTPEHNIFFATAPRHAAHSDILILATPVSQFGAALKSLGPYLDDGTIVTDVGSAKQASIAHIAAALPPGVFHVPCHPLNGNAGSGPLTASDKMFDGKPLILIPHVAPLIDERKIARLWETLGSTVTRMDAQTHDKLVGTMSHLEHVNMFAWMQTQHMREALFDPGTRDPGSWIKSMLRISVAGPEMWSAIFADNRNEILDTADAFRKILVGLTKAIRPENSDELGRRITAAHNYAKEMPSARIAKIDRAADLSSDTVKSAFVGLLSLAITENMQRVECETGQAVAPIANPSLKDGLGPIAIDPIGVETLIRNHRRELSPLITDFRRSLTELTDSIRAADQPALRATVAQVSRDGKLLTDILSGVRPSAIVTNGRVQFRNG